MTTTCPSSQHTTTPSPLDQMLSPGSLDSPFINSNSFDYMNSLCLMPEHTPAFVENLDAPSITSPAGSGVSELPPVYAPGHCRTAPWISKSHLNHCHYPWNLYLCHLGAENVSVDFPSNGSFDIGCPVHIVGTDRLGEMFQREVHFG